MLDLFPLWECVMAMKLYPRLARALYAVYASTKLKSGRRTSVCIDLFNNKKRAERERRRLKRLGNRHVIVVTYDKRR